MPSPRVKTRGEGGLLASVRALPAESFVIAVGLMSCRFAYGAVLVWAAFVASVVPSSAAANSPTNRVTYRITRYTAEQGLPQNSVRALLQTGDGYLWVGTLAGLARFDGVKFKVFNTASTPEMHTDGINALAEDRRDGSLWVLAGDGLLCYRHHQFQRFGKEEGYPAPFGALWPAREGGVWYTPEYGQVVLLQNGSARTWQVRAERILGHQVRQMEEEGTSALLVLMHVGLFQLDLASGAVTPLGPPGTTDRSCQRFVRQSNGTILMAAREGIWRYCDNRWEQVERVPPDAGGGPASILPATGGEWWIPWDGDGAPRVARFPRASIGVSQDLKSSRLPDEQLP
jgi:ligand-binding sensor domain-containing protein